MAIQASDISLNTFGPWLSGFIDAEGSFGIYRNSGRYRCIFALELRQDDLDTLTLIQKYLDMGSVRSMPGRRGHPTAIWSVTHPLECHRLSNLLYHFPLRAKKRRDLRIWTKALKQPHAMPLLAQELHSIRPYTSDLALSLSRGPNFVQWLGGFIEGEGCFQIRKRTRRVSVAYPCDFTLRLRQDDQSILTEIIERTQIGYLLMQSQYRTSEPRVSWNITSKSDALKLIKILDSVSLLTKKAADYQLWREAVTIWQTNDGQKHSRANQFDWSAMAQLRDQLQQGRKFIAPT